MHLILRKNMLTRQLIYFDKSVEIGLLEEKSQIMRQLESNVHRRLLSALSAKLVSCQQLRNEWCIILTIKGDFKTS